MSKIDPVQGVKKQPGSPIADASGSDGTQRSPKPVEFLEDTWLEALKHLSCPKWSKLRLVSPQLNGLIERNVSRLPLAIIDSVEMRWRGKWTEVAMIVSDTPITQEGKNQWFHDCGITVDVPAGIKLSDAIVGAELKRNYSVVLRVFGFGKELFIAEFSPNRNQFSWASMAFFLKLIYDQSTFVKKLSMYPLENKLNDILFPAEKERLIRCGSFKLQLVNACSPVEIHESMSWLEQNVQTVTIEVSTFNDDDEVCFAIIDYLLDSSWINACQEVNLGNIYIDEIDEFFRALVKKFRTLVTVQSTLPIILCRGIQFDGSHADLDLKQLLKNEELENGADCTKGQFKFAVSRNGRNGKTYKISNGVNQMQVELVKTGRMLNSRVTVKAVE